MLMRAVSRLTCLSFVVALLSSCGKSTIDAGKLQGYWVLNKGKSKDYSTSFLAFRFQAKKMSFQNVAGTRKFDCELDYDVQGSKIVLTKPDRCNVGNAELEVAELGDRDLKIDLGGDAHIAYDRAQDMPHAYQMMKERFGVAIPAPAAMPDENGAVRAMFTPGREWKVGRAFTLAVYPGTFFKEGVKYDAPFTAIEQIPKDPFCYMVPPVDSKPLNLESEDVVVVEKVQLDLLPTHISARAYVVNKKGERRADIPFVAFGCTFKGGREEIKKHFAAYLVLPEGR